MTRAERNGDGGEKQKRGWQYWQAPASRGPHKPKDFEPYSERRRIDSDVLSSINIT